jgi:hypothetical protein
MLQCSLINIVGCTLSAPDGSSPRGYSRTKLFLSIGSNIVYSIIMLQLEIFIDNFVGCALNAPDGSSPRGYSRMFSGIVSSIDFLFVGVNLVSSLPCPSLSGIHHIRHFVEYMHPSS